MPRMLLIASALFFANVDAQACDQCSDSGADCHVGCADGACGDVGCVDRYGQRCPLCGERCDCLQEHTVFVPCIVTEQRVKQVVVKTIKEREETYTVFKRVPKKRKYTKERCRLELEVKDKEITCENCRLIDNPSTLTKLVPVPVTEIREGVRRREACTKCGKVCIEEPCTECITRTEQVPLVSNCKRKQLVFEETKKTIDYCVKTPKFDDEFCSEETVYVLEPVTKTRKVQVCVPEVVNKLYEVKVKRMVAKKIVCSPKCWERICREKQRADQREERIAKLKGKVEGKWKFLKVHTPNPIKIAMKATEKGKKAAQVLGKHVAILNPVKIAKKAATKHDLPAVEKVSSHFDGVLYPVKSKAQGVCDGVQGRVDGVKEGVSSFKDGVIEHVKPKGLLK